MMIAALRSKQAHLQLRIESSIDSSNLASCALFWFQAPNCPIAEPLLVGPMP